MKAEQARITEVYQRRMNTGIHDRYSLFNAGELYMVQRREEETLRILRKHGIFDLQRARILDVGCGRGERLAEWIRWGASPACVYGVDLMAPFVRQARFIAGQSNVIVGAAHQMPYPDASFDIVTQSTVFTSILDSRMRDAVAAEMRRVLAPRGTILWYDFRYSNPRNSEVRGIAASEIIALFPDCDIDSVTLTLLPPLTRWLARVSFGVCRILETMLPPLRSHYLAAIRRRG